MIPLFRRVAVTVFLSLLVAALAMDALLRATLRDAHRRDAAALALAPRPPGAPPPGPPPLLPPPPHGSLPPGSLPPIVPITGVLLLVAVSTALVVAAPLTRRIRAIERAVRALTEGNFTVRAEGPRDDALGAVATALDRSAERLDRLFREREELLQAVSHELGTPLSRMRFHLEALGRATTPDAVSVRVRALDDEIRELDELSTELVAWAEADAATLAATAFDPSSALDAMLELERETAARPIETALDVEGAPTVRAERRLFERAVENLVRNALRHARSRVRVTVRREGDAVSVAVLDDGPGIAEADRARVLLPFVRLDPARSRSNGGVGLGLAIARRIVERHGGRIDVDRAPEGGAAFTSWWPAG